MEKVFLGLGSNQGDKQKNIDESKTRLQGSHAVTILKHSRSYSTPAEGALAGPDFLNQVVEVTTSLEPDELLRCIKGIEKQMGRDLQAARWSQRPIDIDILLYERLIMNTPHLKIPHPLMHLRRFVLEPFAEVDAQAMHPIFNKTVAQLLRALR